MKSFCASLGSERGRMQILKISNISKVLEIKIEYAIL